MTEGEITKREKKSWTHRVLISGVSALAMLVCITPVAVAQDSGPVFKDEIIVTARKRPERLIDIPETISAFSAASLEEAGIDSIDKLGQSVPNIVLNRRGDNEPNVVIRGVGSFGNVQGVGFYIDDVQNFTDQAGKLVDLERIEVLKGPQGTLYGGSSIGGAVKYVTKKPTNEFEAKGSVGFGSQSIFNTSASVNVPVSETAAVRVSGYTEKNDGFLENNITGVNNDKSEEFGLRAALRLQPSDDTDINFSLRYRNLINGGNDYYVTSTTTEYKRNADTNIDVFNKREVLGGILDIQHDFGDLSFTSLSSYTERENEILWDLDYGSGDGVWVFQKEPVKTKVLTQEVRLQSENSEGLNWLVGGYYSSVKDRSLITLADVVLGADITGGDSLVLFDFHDNSSLEQTYAGFATLNYESGAFEVSLGARLNHNDFFGENRVNNEELHVKDTVVLPKLTLSYKLDPSTLLYFNVSQGYEPGRITLFNDLSLAAYKPEKAMNFEVGAKGRTSNGMLAYEAAAFFIDSTDRQLETLVVINGVPSEAIGNVGDAKTYGAEVSLTARPTDQWTFNINGGLMDSNFTQGLFDGFEVPFAPSFTGNASAEYSTDISSSLELSFRADINHNGGFFWDTVNTLEQEAFSLVGARIALSDADGRWVFAVRADNLFDAAYNSELQPFDGNLLARRGQPRKFIASLSVSY